MQFTVHLPQTLFTHCAFTVQLLYSAACNLLCHPCAHTAPTMHLPCTHWALHASSVYPLCTPCTCYAPRCAFCYSPYNASHHTPQYTPLCHCHPLQPPNLANTHCSLTPPPYNHFPSGTHLFFLQPFEPPYTHSCRPCTPQNLPPHCTHLCTHCFCMHPSLQTLCTQPCSSFLPLHPMLQKGVKRNLRQHGCCLTASLCIAGKHLPKLLGEQMHGMVLWPLQPGLVALLSAPLGLLQTA